MDSAKPFGLYLYRKEIQDSKVLKDLLQFMKTSSKVSAHSFSYIEGETSLHPHLSLWENIQVELGPTSFREFQQSLKPELFSLLNLIKDPQLSAKEASFWEKFLISLVKGIIAPSQHLLIDLNEASLSPVLIQHFKKSILAATAHKTVILASANSSLWLDCAHTLVSRNEYKFETEKLDSDKIKKHWAA
jgi:ABC-type branched-subunit amino acid transport system ATPase component